MANRIYTLNPKILLAADEGPIYDAMLEHSKILRIAASGTIKELMELFRDLPQPTDPEAVKRLEEGAKEMYAGMHRALTYAFAIGASFAFAQMAKAMGPKLAQERDQVAEIIELDKQRKTDG